MPFTTGQTPLAPAPEPAVNAEWCTRWPRHRGLPPQAKRGDKTPWTDAELEAYWRPSPDFVGPVAPPMWLWLRDLEAQERWKIQTNLAPPGPLAS